MKKIVVLAAIAIVVLSIAAVGMATAAKTLEAGKSNTAHLYLFEKNDTDWTIVDGGAWAKMQYNLAGPEFDFTFNGHGLEPSTEYSLIYYADPWPGNNGTLIAQGTSNNGGNIHLADSVELGMDIPNTNDFNYPDGGKIWLVTTSHYDDTNNKMIGWNPAEYLFENNLITYDETEE